MDNPPAQRAKNNFKLGHGDYLHFHDLVLERSGLHFPEKKRTDLEIGLDKALLRRHQRRQTVKHKPVSLRS